MLATIGINTAINPSGQGIGFAIPINIAKPIMRQAVAGQQLARPFIGVRFQMIDYQLAKDQNLPVQKGAWLTGGPDATGQQQPAVTPGSPADKAGLKDGDIIIKLQGQAIDTEHPLDAVVSQYEPGATVSLEVLRGGSTITVQLTLGTRPANLQ